MKTMVINLQEPSQFIGWWSIPFNVEVLDKPREVSKWINDRDTLAMFNKDFLPSNQVEIVRELENAQCVVLCSGICACCGDTGGEFLSVAKKIWTTNPEMKIIAVCAVIEDVGRWDWIRTKLENTGIKIYECLPHYFHPRNEAYGVLRHCRTL
jgi:hypothetical protein